MASRLIQSGIIKICRSAVSPKVEAYGDEELRSRNFKDTLAIMQQYPALTREVAPWLRLDEVIPYVEANGVRLLGVVVTGPTKEILKLREEPWVAGIGVGEVRLWNWLN
ncbi:anti sigma factor C-terminal domain-containing protein [Paenibacillus sp. y28]|uniref:anti sigma factor C-terminal domain-containing protein n=1 Tax=Paenibacillus sp. y28 TaxID=3129110 RepID=UPI00301691F9